MVVFGSSKPWYESIVIALGASYVATVEYLPLQFDYDQDGVRIETFHVDDPSLRDLHGAFDVAVSISSFEHDGLGRSMLICCAAACNSLILRSFAYVTPF